MTKQEMAEARDREKEALCERLVTEYNDITTKILKAEARVHTVYANKFASFDENRINDELDQQIKFMNGYRTHLMRRMAMLGINLSVII